jgi:hypothetical protein
MESSSISRSDCSKGFITDGYRWPRGLHLVWPGYSLGSYFEGKTVSIPFERNQSNMDWILALYEKHKKLNTHLRLYVTVTGKLLMKDSYMVHDSGYGRKHSDDGFGHLGAVPAQIVVKEIKDPRLDF